VERSFKAITAPPILTSPQKNTALANNPYRLLADQMDPEEHEAILTTVETSEKEKQNQGIQAQAPRKENYFPAKLSKPWERFVLSRRT
jgi:hypothetical protein